MAKTKIKYSSKLKITGFLFVLPVLIYFGIFHFFPIFIAFFNSLFKYDLFKPREFLGFGNYEFIFSNPDFLNSLKVTLLYTAGTCFLIWAVSFGLALLLNDKFPLMKFYRYIFFMPLIISMVVISLIWKIMFEPQGFVNWILNTTKIEWLTNTNLAIWVVIFLSVWKWSGFYIILFLSGLNSIPAEYYEAAKIDGANPRGLFRFMTLPLLKPTWVFVIVISIISSVKTFDPMYLVTKEGQLIQQKYFP